MIWSLCLICGSWYPYERYGDHIHCENCRRKK
jgi:hypothetical protein